MMEAPAESASTREPLTAAAPRIDLATLHLWTAMLGMAMQPISTATGNIGLGIAVGGALLRPAELLQAGRELWQQPWIRWLLAWLAWSWLSLIWSSDRAFGVEQFRCTRVLLWIPVLWPLRHRWWHLAGALLAGTTLMELIQASQVAFNWPPARKAGWDRAGLTTPTQNGLWNAVALTYWLMLAVIAGWRSALASLPPAILSGVALVWSATRAAVIAIAVELLVANALLAFTSKDWRRRALLRACVGLVIVSGSYVLASSHLRAKFEVAAKEVTQTLEGKSAVTVEFRLAMWQMAMEGVRKWPIAGVGIGGIPESIAKYTDVQSQYRKMTEVTMIHSTYMQILAETGLIGAIMFLMFMVHFFRESLRAVLQDPVRITAFGAAVVWFVAAAFDGFMQSGGFLSVGAITFVMACRAGRSADPVTQPNG